MGHSRGFGVHEKIVLWGFEKRLRVLEESRVFETFLAILWFLGLWPLLGGSRDAESGSMGHLRRSRGP